MKLKENKLLLRLMIGFGVVLVVAAVAVGAWAFLRSRQPEPPLSEVFENYVAPCAGMDIQSTAVDGNNCIAADAAFLVTLTEPMERDLLAR